MYEYPPTVSRIWPTFDEPSSLEAVESDCHSSAGQKKVLGEFGWAQGAYEFELSERLEISAMAEPVRGGDAVKSRLNELGGT